VNILLFLATVATVYYFPSFETAAQRVEFTVALMSILVFHEFGHYLAGRRRGVFMSLPYFIPAPNFIGTFGALIKSQSPITNRRDLIETGAAGPIAGFVIAVFALAIGLDNSRAIMADPAGYIQFGDSLLTKFLSWLLVDPVPAGHSLLLSPAASAGWVGLLVTMLNLLPLGQLDGGHIMYGLLGRKQHLLAVPFLAFMILLGFWWPGWWFFGALVFIMRIRHPATLNDGMEVPRSARILGWTAVFIFIICFIPVPFVF